MHMRSLTTDPIRPVRLLLSEVREGPAGLFRVPGRRRPCVSASSIRRLAGRERWNGRKDEDGDAVYAP